MKNFITRAITGILFVAIIIGGILYNPLSFGFVFTLIGILTVWEFTHLINNVGNIRINRVILSLGSAYLFLAFMAYCIDAADSRVFIPYLIIILYLMISELYLKKENPIVNWAYSMLSQCYIALPFALLNVLAFHTNPETGGVEYNPILPLSVFIFIWLNDTGAYCFGMLFGKHRLFERISPKKSWEGSIGGGVVAMAAALGLYYYFPFMSIYAWVGLALVVVLFGTWGDLSESLLKRQLGVKDSGTILPGHGGFLDRFDSALLAIPATVIYLYALTFIP